MDQFAIGVLIKKSKEKEKKNMEKKKGGKLKWVIIAVIVIGVIGAAAGGNDDDKVKDVTSENSVENKENKTDESKEQVPENDGKKEEETSEEQEEKTEFYLGETAEQKGIQITLASVTESQGGEYVKPDDGNIFLIFEFEIANNSEKDINISSIMNFEAYCDDYSLNQDIIGLQAPEVEGKNQLDGSVAAGKKMNGIIAYQVPSGYKSMEINVSPDFWSSKDIKFIYSK